MKQNSEFKKIINDMIREYQDEPSPVASRLYTI